jgi:hypothetical protein
VILKTEFLHRCVICSDECQLMVVV